ncbi:exonuclease domain-containing protein [Miltoncostaea marina]|uniref:exonuclease domain-containing protein n=1 Tax=Miltoncostaea marina TaxID=2843215 RepID=UPI001C3E086C|nr:exonuclease domain-containing protein [Miltoncostaea marina]
MPGAAQLPLPLPAPQPGAEGADSLPDRLCALLARRGRPLEVGHVAAQLLRLRQCPERLQRRLVAEIVEGDPRLAWLGRDLVGLAPENWSTAELGEATFCVVDLETTGGSPGSSKVTEIGAVRVRGLRIEERFATLVNPGRPIPGVVSDLTGIDDAMVAAAPDIADALPLLVEFAGGDVLVAHNAPFDLRFLNYERRRLTGRYFTQPWLDTLTLARRLLDGRVPRHDLLTLATWADTAVRPVHRALPDAEATAELLVVFVGMLAERGISTLERAVAFGGVGGARHAYKLALAETLPPSPGVYLMRDRDGEALYVGKAGNLRRRVRAYFGPGGRHGRLIGRALERLETIDHETCGSEFAALLREDRLIKELRPPCNRRGTSAPGRYLRLAGGRLQVVGAVRDDGARYFGPVRSQRLLRDGVAALRELYPLDSPDPAERERAAEALAAALDGEPAALGGLAVLLGAALAAGALGMDRDEPHDAPRAALGLLTAVARARRAATRTAVIVEPCQAGAEVFFVAGGVVRHRVEVDAAGWAAPVREGLRALRRHARRASLLAADALDEAAIVEERLRRRRDAPGTLPLAPGWRTAAALEEIGRAVAAAAAVGGPPDEEPAAA